MYLTHRVAQRFWPVSTYRQKWHWAWAVYVPIIRIIRLLRISCWPQTLCRYLLELLFNVILLRFLSHNIVKYVVCKFIDNAADTGRILNSFGSDALTLDLLSGRS